MNAPFNLAPPARFSKVERGFTLTELLLVVAILGLMLAIAVPAVTGYPKSKQLSAQADNIQSTLAYARLIAVSSGRPTEVRFYYMPVKENRPDDLQFRAIQVMQQGEDDLMRADGRYQKFEGDVVIIDDEEEYSTILSRDLNEADPNAREIGNRAVEELQYKSFRFLPDGSTDLGKGGGFWTITLVNWNPTFDEDVELPTDFVTLQIDPFNGRVKRYEPGL